MTATMTTATKATTVHATAAMHTTMTYTGFM